MSEQKTIDPSNKPRTRRTLAADLENLGVKEGMNVIVHSSMSAIGWICGGPVAVIQALQDVVTAHGTIIMPTQSPNLSDPKDWENPPVPRSCWQTIREEMPAFDPRITPTFGMGTIVETFRMFPGVKRSKHPTYSFAAWGKHRDEIVVNHSPENGLGEHSPLAKIYDLNGHILLLGVGYDSNTSMHLGEHRSGCLKTTTNGAPIFEKGKRVWKTFGEIEYDEEVFPEIGQAFEQQNEISYGKIGSAESRLMPQRKIVDFTANFLKKGHSTCHCPNEL
ncbi:MAG TPA: AAC(3) family N-acetyltransferase [Bacillales bacterium]|nr:AAC(3) family N-acetyltransferase [Bacillales bacterium]